MRFMTSAPVCVMGDHMIGNSPNAIAQAVMIFGRSRVEAMNSKNCVVKK
jgi:hypothetical protein